MEFWVPLLSALAGALIGSVTSIATMVIQSRRDEVRHLREVAVELALAEHTLHVEIAKAKGQPVLPITAYVAHHLRAMNMARKGYLSPEDMVNLSMGAQELSDALRADKTKGQ